MSRSQRASSRSVPAGTASCELATIAGLWIDLELRKYRLVPVGGMLKQAPGGGDHTARVLIPERGGERVDAQIGTFWRWPRPWLGRSACVAGRPRRGPSPRMKCLSFTGCSSTPWRRSRRTTSAPCRVASCWKALFEGMLQSLDQHSSFINTGEWKQFRRHIEGKFGGIGIQVGVDADTGRLRVIAPHGGHAGVRGRGLGR